jgi:hypothetical protein
MSLLLWSWPSQPPPSVDSLFGNDDCTLRPVFHLQVQTVQLSHSCWPAIQGLNITVSWHIANQIPVQKDSARWMYWKPVYTVTKNNLWLRGQIIWIFFPDHEAAAAASSCESRSRRCSSWNQKVNTRFKHCDIGSLEHFWILLRIEQDQSHSS